MKSQRSLLLTCALLLSAAACKTQPEADAEDFRASPDLAQGPVTDLTMSMEDLAMPDLAPACAFGKESVDGTCQCKATSPNVCPGATHCCGPVGVQTCLSDLRCSSPTARQRHGLAYDPLRQATVVHGGQGAAFATLDDTWELGQVTFSPPLSPTPRPSARYGQMLGWDGNSGRVLLFGGRLGNNTLQNETWSWSGTAWSKLAPTTSPTARDLGAMAWDSGRKRLVLFGGTDANNFSSDETWEWSGANWELRTTAAAPLPREGHAMAYDAQRRQVVLFGGYIGGVGYSNETWTYDGTNWSKPTLTTNPTGRAYFDMAYDEERKVVVMYSGEVLGTSAVQDTWEWDGAAWSKKTPAQSPPQRVNHKLVYDAARKRVLVYAGVTAATNPTAVDRDVWAWDGVNWSKLY